MNQLINHLLTNRVLKFINVLLDFLWIRIWYVIYGRGNKINPIISRWGLAIVYLQSSLKPSYFPEVAIVNQSLGCDRFWLGKLDMVYYDQQPRP